MSFYAPPHALVTLQEDLEQGDLSSEHLQLILTQHKAYLGFLEHCKPSEEKDEWLEQARGWVSDIETKIRNVQMKQALSVQCEELSESIKKELEVLRFMVKDNFAKDSICKQSQRIEEMSRELNDLGYRLTLFKEKTNYLDLANTFSFESLGIWINYLK